VFFWFIGTAVLAVGFVFRDQRFDYRLLMVGSVLPLADGLFGGARALHSITLTIAVLVAVMLATIGRRPLRRTLLGLPIGMFLHLVFDGAWNNTQVFWWPFTGWESGDDALPELDRRVLTLVLELLGLALCAWIWRTNHLSHRERRRAFLDDGQLTLPIFM
jgi:hypothetical protein